MENKSIIEQYEALPQIAKVLILIIVGGLVSAIYRIIRYTETKQSSTLLWGILCFVPCVGFIPWIMDIVSEITQNHCTFNVA